MHPEERYKELLKWLRAKDKVLLAFSGGVDSSLLSYAAMEALPQGCTAFMADIPYLSRRQRELSLAVAEDIDLPLIVHEVTWDELRPAHGNDLDRCYHCKKLIYSQARSLAEDLGIEWVLDGENADDRAEHRPGRRAAAEEGILSPLRDLDFSRGDVEHLIKALRVPVRLEKETCLATRISGQPITPSVVREVETGEEAIRSICDIRELRLRRRNGHYVIQVSDADLPVIMSQRQAILDAFTALGLEPPALSLQPYRSHR